MHVKISKYFSNVRKQWCKIILLKFGLIKKSSDQKKDKKQQLYISIFYQVI
jgi:hypothetical protein